MINLHDTLRDNKNKYIPAAAAIMALGTTACNAETPGTNRDGEINRNITSISVDDGANVRETPIKGDADANNLLVSIDQPVVLSSPNGVATYEDTNGTWYSVPAESLAEQIDDEAARAAILEDEDGKVWVNDDRATPEYKDQ